MEHRRINAMSLTDAERFPIIMQKKVDTASSETEVPSIFRKI
jgi:hypothetical protein